MRKQIEIFALQNAVKFKGKANPGAIIGQLFAKDPSLRSKGKELSTQISEVVREVNALSLDEQKARLEKVAPGSQEKKVKKKKELPALKNVNGPVVTRIPPEPSKYLHIGHAFSFLVNYMYAQKYNGKCVLRLDDTNPEKSKKEYYESIYDDLLWLRIKVDDTVIASKRMEEFYEAAEKLINEGQAYVCFCDREIMSNYRFKSMICDHREQSVRNNVAFWDDMQEGKIKQGEAVLRLRGEMDHFNATMRDPVLFRISDAEHTMQGDKYRVWPMYDFETVVAENFCNITHVLRSNEFGKMRGELQNYIKDLLGFKKQEIREYGRFSVVGSITKGREIRAMIESGEVNGWDDPRLVTIKALRRRGILPETMYELVLEAGMSPTETNIDWSVIASINRKILDPITKRFFFVKDPHVVSIAHSLGEVEVPLHPTNKEMGFKKVKLGSDFFVHDHIEPEKNYRFMHMFNFIDKKYISSDYDAGLKAKIIHAVPCEGAIDVEVLMSDGSTIKGKGEKALEDLKEGEVVQFERMFFCKLDNKEKMLFVYTHD
jgi:glutamyl-tRNA synthetase